jgi:hypothetical protein
VCGEQFGFEDHDKASLRSALGGDGEEERLRRRKDERHLTKGLLERE